MYVEGLILKEKKNPYYFNYKSNTIWNNLWNNLI